MKGTSSNEHMFAEEENIEVAPARAVAVEMFYHASDSDCEDLDSLSSLSSLCSEPEFDVFDVMDID